MKREAGQSLKNYFWCWSRQMTGHLLARSTARLLPLKRPFFLPHGGCCVSVNEMVISALHVMFYEHSQVIKSQEHLLNTYLLMLSQHIGPPGKCANSAFISKKVNKQVENQKHTVPCIYANMLQNIATTARIILNCRFLQTWEVLKPLRCFLCTRRSAEGWEAGFIGWKLCWHL